MNDIHNRRAFLRAAMAAGAAWAAADLVHVEEALAWTAHQAAGGGAPPEWVALTPDQGRVLEAAAARIIPSIDGRPGAREAGAVHFIDRSLSTFNASRKPFYASGVADLNRRAARAGGRPDFAALTPAQQDDVIRQIEPSPFFQALRFDTIVGTFALPAWGANRDYAGWHMLGFDHQPRFQAPFGYYDADVNRRS